MIRATIDDPEMAERLDRLPRDGATTFTLEGDEVRGILVSGTRMVNEMRANHGLGPLEAMVLGKGYLCAALLGATLKGDDSLSLRVDCEGPVQGYSCEGNAKGGVRGRLFVSPIPLPPGGEGLDPTVLIGRGSLIVTRLTADMPQPFVSQVALASGNLADDLTHYYLASEQTRTALRVGLSFDRKGRITGAGGLFLQALPGAGDEALGRVENLLLSLPQLGDFFAEGGSREALARSFALFDVNILGEKPVDFFCPCDKPKFAAFLASLGEKELRDLAENRPFALQTTCYNCGSVYSFSREELRAIADHRT